MKHAKNESLPDAGRSFRWSHTIDSLRFRDYKIIWFSSLFLSGSYWLQLLVIGWLTYDMTGSAILTSIAVGIDALPFLVLSGIGGILADRWDRRHMIATAGASQTVLTLGLGLLVILDLAHTWMIMVYVAAMGCTFAIVDPCWLALIAGAVPKNNLVNVFALHGLAANGSRLIFPFIGGLIIASFGPGQALIGSALIYLLVAAAVLTVTKASTPDTGSTPRAKFQQFMDGIWYVVQEPALLGALLIASLSAVTFYPAVNRMMPVYASEVFAVGPTGLSVLFVSIGIGSTIGGVVLASLGPMKSKGRTLILTLILLSAVSLVFSLTNHFIIATGLLILISGVATVNGSMNVALMLEISPIHLRGRVSSLLSMSFGLCPIGSVIFGGLAQIHGPQEATLIASAVMSICCVLVALRFRQLWIYN